MTLYKILILLVTSCIYTNTTQAQNADINQSKYWFYRARLNNEFMVQGESSCGQPSGLTIPASANYLEPKVGYDTKINFGDGSSFLGYYIGVLATEFKLLSNQGAPQVHKDKVKQELYFAMKAMERLDKNAETLVPASDIIGDCNDQSHFNGFFMRDDVPSTQEDPTLSQEFNNKFPRKFNREIGSDFGENKHKNLSELGTSNMFMSQDQAADLSVGLSLVIKLMDNESWLGYNFKNNAMNYADKIFSNLRDENYFIPIPGQTNNCYQQLHIFDWINHIFDDFPMMRNVDFNPGYSTNCLVKYGGMESRVSAYPMAKAGSMMKNDKMGAYDKLSVITTPADYDNYISTLTKGAWDSFNYPGGEWIFENNLSKGPDGRLKPTSNDYNNAIISTWAAIGNSWEVGFIPNKVLDEEVKVPTPCFTSRCRQVCGAWPFHNDCHNICVDEPDVCHVSLGHVQVWCYSLPTDYITNVAIYNTFKNNLGLGQFTGGLTTLLNTMNGLNISTCLPTYGGITPPKITYNTTAHALSQYGNKYGVELFPILHQVLHDGKGDYSYNQERVNRILDEAPCNGPHYLPFNDPHVPPNDMGVYGWRNDNRFQKTVDATLRSAGHCSLPGLDYMLFYNLNQLVNGNGGSWDHYGSQKNMLVNNLTFPKPTSEGSNANQKIYASYESIDSDNVKVINGGQTGTTGNVVLKAAYSITITNYSVDAGANFSASIEEIHPCNDYNNKRVANNINEEKKLTQQQSISDEEFKKQVSDAIAKTMEEEQRALKKFQKQSYKSVDNYLSEQSTNTLPEDFNVIVFPNPVTNSVTVSSITNYIDQVTIIDNMGNELETFRLSPSESKIEIPTSNLKEGIYFIKILSNGKLEMKKINKIK